VKSNFIIVQLITLSRIPMAMVFGLVLNFADWSYGSLLFCLILLGLIEISDLLDGFSARRFGLVSEHGAMLDPYADSVSRLIVFWSMASVHYILFLVPLVMALRDVTVAYSRIILTKHNRSVAAKRSGKIKAIVQGVGAFFILLGPVYWPVTGEWPKAVLSWIVIIATAASVVEYAASAVSVSLEQGGK
jgi:CDP-diacylglycerol--glycerol-3-phosphate 3-phosphatidyltransferase